MVFKVKVQAGRGQLLNETVFYRVCKVDIDLLENDVSLMWPHLGTAWYRRVLVIHSMLVKLVCKIIG